MHVDECHSMWLHYNRERYGRMLSTVITMQMFVMAGGDGFEDFADSTTTIDDDAGEEDSTNHMLIWEV